ncbi:MAG TPA: hypothetical protein VH186_14145 [Chloroflexia bacterium]|nr:hypothetical protein [Chloroflexia bacterium]
MWNLDFSNDRINQFLAESAHGRLVREARLNSPKRKKAQKPASSPEVINLPKTVSPVITRQTFESPSGCKTA